MSAILRAALGEEDVRMILYITASSGKNLELAEALRDIGDALLPDSESQVVNLEAYALPLYTASEDEREFPPSVLDLTRLLAKAKACVYVAPEYNGSTPPAFSNAIAWISRSGGDDWRNCFNHKLAAIATHSGGGGHHVLSAMRMQLGFLGTTVLGRQLMTNYSKPLNPDSAREVLQQLFATAGLIPSVSTGGRG